MRHAVERGDVEDARVVAGRRGLPRQEADEPVHHRAHRRSRRCSEPPHRAARSAARSAGQAGGGYLLLAGPTPSAHERSGRALPERSGGQFAAFAFSPAMGCERARGRDVSGTVGMNSQVRALVDRDWNDQRRADHIHRSRADRADPWIRGGARPPPRGGRDGHRDRDQPSPRRPRRAHPADLDRIHGRCSRSGGRGHAGLNSLPTLQHSALL